MCGAGLVTHNGVATTKSIPRYTVGKKPVKSTPMSALECAVSIANEHI